MSNELFLSKEDYEEPCCPLSKPGAVQPIPVSRVLEKLDEYLNRNDYPSAERHLLYWLSEAENGGDSRGALTILNEQIGLYRKLNQPAKGLPVMEKALALVDEAGLSGSVTAGTTYINIATAYKAFGHATAALPLYQKAEQIYVSALEPTDSRLGGLYNNMALAVLETGDYPRARALFQKALDIVTHLHSHAEVAITHCNMADLVAAEQGTEAGEAQIAFHLDTALAELHSPDLPHDGYYAFVCEKCAPTFGYYGYFMAEIELKEKAKDIYERN